MNHPFELTTPIPDLPLLHQGKVREIYQVDADHLLFVASDRISAFDVVLPSSIPGKGALLTQISRFWFEKTAHIVPNHLTDLSLHEVLDDAEVADALAPRSMIVKRLKPLPVEAIVRGYLVGSGWKDYVMTSRVSGQTLPAGLEQAARLPTTLFTPSTKASVGDHDVNISFEVMADTLGQALAAQVREVSLALYAHASDHARSCGIILADSKFEFGLDQNDSLVLMDELFTPDSSRFWPAESYRTGISPPSYDKQIIRDYLETLDWDKTAPGPSLPASVIRSTQNRYNDAWQALTGAQHEICG